MPWFCVARFSKANAPWPTIPTRRTCGIAVIGNIDDLNVRVDIDELDAQRFRAKMSAAATPRPEMGNRCREVRADMTLLMDLIMPYRRDRGDMLSGGSGIVNL